MSNSDTATPPFDVAKAAALIGKTVLMAIRYRDGEGNLLERQQLFGSIISADEREGVKVRLAGSREGEVFILPPELRYFEKAKPGSYTLKSTGEVVRNPDLILTASIRNYPPAPGGLA